MSVSVLKAPKEEIASFHLYVYDMLISALCKSLTAY